MCTSLHFLVSRLIRARRRQPLLSCVDHGSAYPYPAFALRRSQCGPPLALQLHMPYMHGHGRRWRHGWRMTVSSRCIMGFIAPLSSVKSNEYHLTQQVLEF